MSFLEIHQQFEEMKQKLASLQSELDKNKQELERMKHSDHIQRRDINDLHTITMLRSAARHLVKKKRIAFIGTGQINENVLHAYIQFQQAVRNKAIDYDGDAIFVARSELEYKLLKQYGFPVEIWKYQPLLTYYLLQAKVVVVSSHIMSEWGNCLLSNCLAEAIKVELWHGLPAKIVATSCIDNRMEFHFFARLLEDSVSTKHICIQSSNPGVVAEYARAFPSAIQHITGDCRNDILFDKAYRDTFLANKSSQAIQQWLANNRAHIKVLYTPTFREDGKSIATHYHKMLALLSVFDGTNVRIAVKLHVYFRLSPQQQNKISEICRQKGHLLIEQNDEAYSTFSEFDAMIADYSSIRVDFAITGKPVFLWRFDNDTYQRPRDIVSTFPELDQLSYHLSDDFKADEFLSAYQQDIFKRQRQDFVEYAIKSFSCGDSGRKTIDVLLNIVNNEKALNA